MSITPATSGPPIAPALLTAPQAAAYLSISERLLWSLTQRGELPAVKIGRAVRYHRPDLEAWIEARKKAALAGGPRLHVQPSPPA
jgi:excisionase family DNA binding protein